MPNTITAHIELDEERELRFLTGGELERVMKAVEDALGVSVSARGGKVMIQGEEQPVARATTIINEVRELRLKGLTVSPDDLRVILKSIASGEDASLTDFFARSIPVSPKKRSVVPKSRHQMDYIEAIKAHDIVFGIGPAGTGKTYLAMAMAINALLSNRVSRVVLARPAVEAGEKLGFLPGDIQDKVNPYLRPLYDALYDMLELERANKLIERGVIEIAPLAFMRGRTLNDSFIILDEAQNTTTEQMKMYLTRLGFNSKTVITGDLTQVDLPTGRTSGLLEAKNILTSIEGIKIVYFSDRDVVRHKLVQEIVKAYDRHDERKREG